MAENNSNQNLVEKMVNDWHCSETEFGCPNVRNAVKEAIQAKDKELKNHEQSLLWTVQYILDRLCVEGEAREIALNDFQSQLINNFEN